jgi:hypothetical protein
LLQVKERLDPLEHSFCIEGAADSEAVGRQLRGVVMHGVRTNLAILATFALMIFGGDTVAAAAGLKAALDGPSTAWIGTTNGTRTLGDGRLLKKAPSACISSTCAGAERHSAQRLGPTARQHSRIAVKSRVFKNQGRRQIFDVYLPSHPSDVLVLHYAIWLQLCRQIDYRYI